MKTFLIKTAYRLGRWNGRRQTKRKLRKPRIF